MSNGKTHDLYIGAAAVVAVATTCTHAIFTDRPEIAAAGLAFAIACSLQGRWLSPDLDLKRNNARNRWKTLGLGWYWGCYERCFRHRSKWSHTPAIADFIRIAYVLPILPIVPVAIAVNDASVSGRAILAAIAAGVLGWQQPEFLAYGAIAGVPTAGFIHWVLDGCPTNLK